MHLAAFLYPTGYHVAAWRLAEAHARMGADPVAYREMTRACERACFDFVFLPDSMAMRGSDVDILSRSAINYVAQLEPLTLAASLCAATERIGVVASASTTYNHPFTVARQILSLDHVAAGRAGWNLVTSQNVHEAGNFGREAHVAHDARYERAESFVDVVTGLWDSFADDAFVCDKAAGRFFDPGRLRALNHADEHFRVRGPLNVPRSPQGRPVVLQAGASPPGRALAARTADVVFCAQNEIGAARAFREDIRARAAAFGRDPDTIRVLPGVMPIVAPTAAEARAAFERLQALITPEVGLALLAGQLGEIDLSGHPVDAPLPELPETLRTDASRSRPVLLLERARAAGLTLRDLYREVAASRGHLLLVGDPVSVVDELERWVTAGAADGFNVMPAALPSGLEAFIDLCVPELRRRGLFRERYEGTTLREHLGLARPERRAVP
jgi:FMN-dependent oxidoreductase (nitrilotriacetate monooxygenase family)